MDFKKFKKLIMIEQTLFALPFAYIGLFFAGGATVIQWLWISFALFGARTAGMSFNRLLDADIDAENPRTADRLVPSGEVTKFSVWILSILSIGLLIFSSYMLNMLVFYLSFVATFLLFTYSLFKRFSASSHFYLGIVEAAAPIGGYLAVAGKFDLLVFLPGIAILFWIAGIDIIYSMQDAKFDKDFGLHSIPSKYGISFSYKISAFSYFLAVLVLVVAGIMANLGIFYYSSLVVVSYLFIKQQVIARNDIEKIEENMLKVFGLNRYVSPVLLAGMVLDYFLKF